MTRHSARYWQAHDMLVPGKTVEVAEERSELDIIDDNTGHSRIAVRTPLGPIDNVEVLERELELARQSFDAVTKLALWQRRELVEQRLNEGRVDELEEDNEDEAGERQSSVREHLRRSASWLTRRPSSTSRTLLRPSRRS